MRELPDRRVDVTGQREVDEGQRTRGTRAGGGDLGEPDQRLGRPGAGDDHVGLDELGAEGRQRQRGGGVLGRETVGASGRAVEHRDPRGSAAGEVGDRERRHRTGADDDGPGTRELDAAALQRGTDQGGGGAIDRRLGVRTLADPQRLLEEGVEGRADAAVLLALAQRLAGLAEDLSLADHHRVETGGHLEEVGDRAVVVVDVEVRQQ